MPRHRQTVICSPNDTVFLLNLKDSLELGAPTKLSLTEELTDVDVFTRWLESIPAGSIPKLSMPISLSLLKEPAFLNLLKTFKNKSPDILELDFGDALEAYADEIERELIANIVPLVDFPIQIKNKKLVAFEQAMIRNLQSKPKSRIIAADYPEEPETESLSVQGKKIRLKTLIQTDTHALKEEYRQFINIDVEHVEVVEQNVDVEENVEVEQLVEHISPYEGDLVDYTAFSSGTYRAIARANFGDAPLNAAYELIRQELFANLPHSIKYLSPTAAEKLAAHLPQWAAMNKDNCAPFVLKETLAHEFVLDYEGDENDEKKPFTLHEFSPYEDSEPYYDVLITSPNPDIAALFFRDPTQIKKLSNLWIRHGDKGIADFYDKLNQLNSKHPDLSSFLVDNYLNHFAHWEPFYNENFFEALLKLRDYTSLQMNCLKRFLVNTGCSQHNLSHTLEDFDAFWHQLKTLCKGDESLMHALDTNWSTPIGGQPAVYMQRLLTILKKARYLPDQLVSLDGIILSQYGAYYASCYEGFTEVHPAMGFTYRPDADFNTKVFNPHFNLYRVNIETLEYEANKSRAMTFNDPKDFLVIPKLQERQLATPLDQLPYDKMSFADYLNQEEDRLPPGYHLYLAHLGKLIPMHYERDYTLPMTIKAFSQLAHRYIGQQLAGISVQSLHAHLKAENSWNRSLGDNSIGSFRLRLLQTLLFVTSDRYKGSVTLQEKTEDSTFKRLMEHTDPADFFKMDEVYTTIARLKQLQANHVSFSDQEAFFYQDLQQISMDLNLPLEEKIKFFFTRVNGLRERFINHNEYARKYGNTREYREKDVWLYWFQDAQNDFRERLHHRLLNNKPSTLKFINLVGPHHAIKHRVFLYALNTEEFLAEIPQIVHTYRDDLLAFSAQLVNDRFNLISSDFSHAIKTTDEDVVQLKKIRDYLHQSTQGDLLQNYLHYTIQRLMDSNTLLTYEQVLHVFDAVSGLKPASGQLDTEAVHAILQKYAIPVHIKLSQTLNRDDRFVKSSLMDMLTVLEVGLPLSTDEAVLNQFQEKSAKLMEELEPLGIPALQERFTRVLPTCSILVRTAISVSLKNLLKTVLHREIEQLFAINHDTFPEFTQQWIQFIESLKDFQDPNDFVAVDQIANKVKPIAIVFAAVARNPSVVAHQKEVIQLFSTLNFAQIDSELILYWLDFLSDMPQRDYLPLLKTLVSHPELVYQKNTFKALIYSLKTLNTHEFSTEAMLGFYQRFVTAPATLETQYDPFIRQLATHFGQNNNDPIVALCLTEPNFSLTQAITISDDTHQFNLHRTQLADLYKCLQQKNQLDRFLQLNLDPAKKPMILNILALAYSGRRLVDKDIDLFHVTKQLTDLNPDQLTALNTHYDSTLTSIHCLTHALNDLKQDEPFSNFLDLIEKSPFGLRDLEAQFNTDEVERVVNGFLDLQRNVPYPYHHRRQLMETFLLVNELGRTLPVYHNKPAKDLSNAEIKECFAKLRDNTSHYSKTQRKILTLTIMREAMYRATGQFPFSTQMIGLIDCMLHQGDIIANIDTGQGKSLIDVMKAAFLYLESDRVDISTSTLVDAARDIENYSPFLSLLGIPFSKKPINANTPLDELCLNGINFSTFSQLALRLSKALAAGEVIDPPSQRVSLVLNESDYALLDDRAIKRLASPPAINITKKHPWIYEAINTFVTQDYFRGSDTSADEDARRLRRYLVSQAKLLGKSRTFINQIEKETLITWIESAILVNYTLRENLDYVILPVPGKAGKFFARILMNDSRPSTDSVFGKGIQQLLHARLNQEKRFKDQTGEDAFEITPENRTIISTDNRTLVNYYRSKKGFIWGSSGTVGSNKEVEEQVAKFGFAFSKIEPHQKKQVQEKAIVILKGKEAHYQRLVDELKKKRRKNTVPLVIFCENIDKAKDIHAYMIAKLGAENIQLNIGTNEADAEKTLIKNAATPNMCTITTAAIGRNTDIPYDKSLGLDIWFTSVASTRLDRQKLGRTGRQGSPGTISYFLNKEDQNIKSKEDIVVLRETLDAAGEKERSYHESLYKIIGFFLAQLDQAPSGAFTHISKRDFIYRKWADYSDKLEKRYRELVLKQEFDQHTFFEEAKLQFITLLQAAAPDYQLNDLTLDEVVFQKEAFTHPYTKPVRLNECTPAFDIAYQLFHQQMHAHPIKQLAKAQKDRLLKELKTIFFTQGRELKTHTQFFNALLESEASCNALKDLYQTFLRDFLRSNQPSWFFMRWLGLHTPLNDLADNRHYLMLFRGLASIDPEKPLPDVDEIKRLAIDMIEEYLQNSWWIGHEKRVAAVQLQREILSSPDLNSVIKAVCDSQVAIAEKDIELNKNYFGNSRLQNTLSRILTMAASLGIETNTHDLISQLSQHFTQLTAAKPEEALDPEAVKHKIKTTSGNARVLAKSLSKALQLSDHKNSSLPGMEGRKGPKT